jgi:small subunit ribosomal protein S20
MADHKSALKRHRQSIKRAFRNSHYRSTLKTFIKRARAAAAEKKPEAEELVKAAISYVGKVGGKGIIPKKRASRYASKLSTLLQK